MFPAYDFVLPTVPPLTDGVTSFCGHPRRRRKMESRLFRR